MPMRTLEATWGLAGLGTACWLVGLSTVLVGQEVVTSSQTTARLLSATAAVRHAARFASSVSCLVPDMGRADRPAPRVEGWMEGRPAAVLDGAAEEPVAVVRGRVGAVESRLTADGSRVFTVYRLVIAAVITPQARLPLAAGQTIVVSRPGGRVPQGERTAIVVVAGFGTIAVDDRVTVGVVAEAGGDGYHEVRPALPGGLGGVR